MRSVNELSRCSQPSSLSLSLLTLGAAALASSSQGFGFLVASVRFRASVSEPLMCVCLGTASGSCQTHLQSDDVKSMLRILVPTSVLECLSARYNRATQILCPQSIKRETRPLKRDRWCERTQIRSRFPYKLVCKSY